MKRLLFCLMALMSGFAMGQAREVVHLANGEWPPYLSENLAHFGIASHIVSRAFELEGIEVKYVFLPWKRAYEAAKAGIYAGTLVWRGSPERERDFWFSDSVFEGQTVFFHHRDLKFDWGQLDDLAGMRIGATLGYQYRPLETAEREGHVLIERVASDELNLRKLIHGRIDLFPSDLAVGYATLRALFPSKEREQIRHHALPLEVVSYYLMLNRQDPNHPQLIERFNRGLRKLKESGEYARMFEALQRGDYETPP